MNVIAEFPTELDDDVNEAGYMPFSASEKALLYETSLMFEKRLQNSKAFVSAETVKGYLATKLGSKEREIFAIMFLDASNRLIKFEELFKGGISDTVISPRVCVQEALRCNSSKVILSHCHTGNSPKPSTNDIEVTEQVIAAFKLVNIKVLDHLIVAGGRSFSFAENQLII